jgi:hypothetical protein
MTIHSSFVMDDLLFSTESKVVLRKGSAGQQQLTSGGRLDRNKNDWCRWKFRKFSYILLTSLLSSLLSTPYAIFVLGEI